MDLSSSLSGTKEFRIVKRGYDPDEVDSFLDQIALGVAELKRKVAEANDKAAAAAVPSSLAPRPPSPAADAEANEIHRALILAQRAADDEVRKATEQGERLLADTQAEADEMRRQADVEVARRRDEARLGLVDEINELESVREALTNDISVLERHVEEQREVVQAAVGELQSLLDHPEAFRVADPAGVSSVVAPSGVLSTSGPPPAEVPASWPTINLDEEVAKGEHGEPPIERPHEPAAAPGEPSRSEEVSPLTAAISPVAPAVGATAASGGAGGHDAASDDDAFLAELRKAMLDDEPLGPRDEMSPSGAAGLDDELNRSRTRFGRRR